MISAGHALDIAASVVFDLEERLTREVNKHATTGDNLTQVSVAAAQLTGAKKVLHALNKEMT